jgi:hypothetical protein
MSWQCSCGILNSGSNKYCAALRTWKTIRHEQVSSNTPDWVMSYLAAKELNVTPEEELYAKFYNHQRVLVKDMEFLRLREHRKELANVALEAKARVVATDDELRERNAKTNNKEWLTTDTRQPYDVSSAINVPKLRKARMSKMDRLREQLVSAGLDDATVNQMIGNLEKNVPDNKLKTVTFKADKTSTVTRSVQVKPVLTDKKPFNPASLKFGKKDENQSGTLPHEEGK